MSFNKKKGAVMSVQAISPANVTPQMVQSSAQQVKPVEQPVVVQQMIVEPKERKGFMEGVSNIVKFFTTLGEMTKATIKAAWYGGLTMLGGLAAFWAFGSLPSAFQSVKGGYKEMFKHSFKNIAKSGKIASGIAAGTVAAYHIVKGVLKSNTKTANVDHALRTGHRDV